MSSASFARRDHVPAELMRDYDHVNGPEVMAFPPAAIDKVRDDEHPVFFSSRHGGFWVLTRTTTSGRRSWTRSCFRSGGEASRRTRLTGCSSRSTSIRRAPPVPQADGAAFLTRPGRQAGTDRPPGGRDRIAELAAGDGCEFVHYFALVLPGALFCGLLGLPVTEFSHFNQMAMDLIYAPALVRKEHGDDAAKAKQRDASRKIEAFHRGPGFGQAAGAG